MDILITGGCGFLGARLARTLLQRGSVALAGAAAAPITSITLTDRAEPPADLAADARVRFVGGDLLELASSRQLPAKGTQLVFHLSAAVSGECEADFDLGMRSNFAATHALLESARALGTKPVVVFASSLAVFGKQPGRPMPDPILDDTLPTPQSSYGIQKFIGEQLVADYARKGFITGRSTRLMTVSVRPGRPNGAASGFFSGMIREPLAGVRAQVPVGRDVPVALASPARTVEGIIRAAEASAAEWGPLTGLNLPALATTVGAMADALEQVAGREATALLDWTPDAAIQKLVDTWPGNIRADRAAGLGLMPDASFEQVIRDYVRENPQAIKLNVR
jgi:nucleoside-diphosphate-sugar epimerase